MKKSIFALVAPVAMNLCLSASASAAGPAAYEQAITDGFEPTVLTDMNTARALFNSLPRLNKDSQCYHRSVVWSDTLEKKFRVKTMNATLFLTPKFRLAFATKEEGILGDSIKPYPHMFECAPMAYVRHKGQIVEVVFDKANFELPVTVNEWTNHFTVKSLPKNTVTPRLKPSEARCDEILRYVDSIRDGSNAWCLVRKAPMYYAQPVEIEELDRPAMIGQRARPRIEFSKWMLELSYKSSKLEKN